MTVSVAAFGHGANELPQLGIRLFLGLGQSVHRGRQMIDALFGSDQHFHAGHDQLSNGRDFPVMLIGALFESQGCFLLPVSIRPFEYRGYSTCPAS